MKCEICDKEVQFPCQHHTPEEMEQGKKKRSKPKDPEKDPEGQ